MPDRRGPGTRTPDAGPEPVVRSGLGRRQPRRNPGRRQNLATGSGARGALRPVTGRLRKATA